MGNSDSTKFAVDQSRESYADDAKARRVLSVNSAGTIVKTSQTSEFLAGSAGDGNDGDSGQTFTLATSSAVDIVMVFQDGTLLTPTTHYTIDNSAKTVTIIGAAFDSQTIGVFYNV